MTYTTMFLAALAFVATFYAGCYLIGLKFVKKRPARPVVVRTVAAAFTAAPLVQSGRLRAVVCTLDDMIVNPRLRGRMTPVEVREHADSIARRQTSPDVVLEHLSRDCADLLNTHSHGYWLLSSALVRAAYSQRRAVV